MKTINRKDFLEKIKSVLNIDTTFVQYGNIYANADVVPHLKKANAQSKECFTHIAFLQALV